jgi:hypothetical protein
MNLSTRRMKTWPISRATIIQVTKDQQPHLSANRQLTRTHLSTLTKNPTEKCQKSMSMKSIKRTGKWLLTGWIRSILYRKISWTIKRFSKSLKMEQSLSSFEITTLAEESRFRILATRRKTHKSTQITRKCLSTWRGIHSGSSLNCSLPTNFLCPIHNRILCGVCCWVCLGFWLKRARLSIKVPVSSSHWFAPRSSSRQGKGKFKYSSNC